MQNRVVELRNKRHLTQEELARRLSLTQQSVSRYEKNIFATPTDVLIKIAEYFNVSTDYLLGITETKRDFEGQLLVNRTLEKYHDFIEVFKTLDEEDQELVRTMVEKIKQIKERKGLSYVEYSSL